VLRAYRVHYRAQIVHPVFKGWQFVVWHAIGKPGAAFIKHDQSRKGAEPSQKSSESRLLPGQLDMRNPARNVNEIDLSFAHHLIGNVEITAPSVLSLGQHFHLVGVSLSTFSATFWISTISSPADSRCWQSGILRDILAADFGEVAEWLKAALC
jgi:hypothetical protein